MLETGCYDRYQVWKSPCQLIEIAWDWTSLASYYSEAIKKLTAFRKTKMAIIYDWECVRKSLPFSVSVFLIITIKCTVGDAYP